MGIVLFLIIALISAFGFHKIDKPSLLGYIITGIFLGPALASNHLKCFHDLGEIGLLLLLFQIGIELDLKSFKEFWKKSLIIFFIQLFFSFCFSILYCYFSSSDFIFCLLMTFLLVLSSTAVVIRLLNQMNRLYTKEGSLIVSILILQDLSIVPITIILSQLQNTSVFTISYKMFISMALLCILIKYLSSDHPGFVGHLKFIVDGDKELLSLSMLCICFIASYLSEFIGLSHSYGPFLAGLMIGSCGSKHDLIDVVEPITSILLMIFFVYVGSMIDMIYMQDNLRIIIYLSIVLLFGKILINYLSLKLVGLTNEKSFFISSVLSQASEFSFSFISIAAKAKSTCTFDYNLISTLCIISLTLGTVVPLFAATFSKIIFRSKEVISNE